MFKWRSELILGNRMVNFNDGIVILDVRIMILIDRMVILENRMVFGGWNKLIGLIDRIGYIKKYIQIC